MKLMFFQTNPKYIYGAVFLTVLLIVLVPMRNTFQLVSKFQRLNDKHISSTVTFRAGEQDKLLLQDLDHSRKVVNALSQSCKANGVIIKQVELPTRLLQEKVLLHRQQIIVEGSFINILKSLDAIAKTLEPVKISSLVFHVETINKVNTLTARIIFQSVKLPDDDNE